MSDADDPRRAAASETAMTAQAKAPMSRGRRAALWIGAPLALIALVAALAVAAIVWSLQHPAGSAWLLGRVPGLTIVDPEGSLIGDFAATRVVYAIGAAGELRLEALRWHGLAASRGDGGRWLHLVIDSVHA